MAYDFVLTSWFDRKLWKLSDGIWSEITPTVPSSYSTQTVMKSRDGSIWRHDGYPFSGLQNFLRLSGGSWASIPASNSKEPDDYAESEFGHVYTCRYSYTVIGRILNGVWLGDVDVSHIHYATGYNTIWCDGTGQHVYAATLQINNPGFLIYSNDYGATFSDITPEFREANTYYGGLWGFGYGTDHIVVLGGSKASPRGGKLIAGKAGGPWATLASQLGYMIGRCTWGPDLDNLVCLGTLNATEGCAILKRNGSGLDVVLPLPEAKTDVREGREISGSGTEIVANFRRQDAFQAKTYRSTDGGDNWAEVSMAGIPYLWMSGISVPLIQSEYVQVPPVLQNQDPAPSSTDNAADTGVYLEVYDENENLDLSTVGIYVDGNLAWTAEAPTSGYSGRTKLVTLGTQGYWLNQWDYFDPGEHTVRVIAEDDLGYALDDTYTFSTVQSDQSRCGRLRWGQFNCLS